MLCSAKNKTEKGQSFVELTLVVLFLMIFVAGIIEFGFMLNNYLNLVDASRETVRRSASYDPFIIDPETGNKSVDQAFYEETARFAEEILAPVVLDPSLGDDIVVTFFSVGVIGGNRVYDRYPNDNGWSAYGNQVSKLSDTDIQNRLDWTAPNTGVLLVEIFYNYPQVLKLPVFTAFLPDPIPVYAYAIMPLTAAEPGN